MGYNVYANLRTEDNSRTSFSHVKFLSRTKIAYKTTNLVHLWKVTFYQVDFEVSTLEEALKSATEDQISSKWGPIGYFANEERWRDSIYSKLNVMKRKIAWLDCWDTNQRFCFGLTKLAELLT